MIIKTIDLYDYYGMPRPTGEKVGGRLDVYVPRKRQTTRAPGMLILPGGAYHGIAEHEGAPIAMEWMRYGYHCFVLTYSVAPQVYPTQLLEASLAMRYIRETEEEYGTDPAHVAAVGFSAGAHLTATLASVATNREIREILGEKAELAIPNAVVLSYGVVSYDAGITHMGTFKNLTGNRPELFEYVDPVRMLTSASAPAFLWHTRRDQGVPFRNSVNYALRCDELGIPCELHVYDRGFHGLGLATPAAVGDGAEESAATWPMLAEAWLRNILGFRIITPEK